MNKLTKIVFLVAILSLLFKNSSFASDDIMPIQNEQSLIEKRTEQIAQVEEPINVPNTQIPGLIAPVVEDPNIQKKDNQTKSGKTKKIDLRAVIFDPNADFSTEANDENREMTKLEELEYNLNKALHCEVSSVDNFNKKGILSKGLFLWRPKFGPVDSITEYTSYRGYSSNIWLGSNYQNTLYTEDKLAVTFEGKFRNKKLSFRSMFFLEPGKNGHDFFNDVWGDQYIQYAWSKNDQVLFGYKRNSVGFEGSMGPWTLPFVARSQLGKAYGNVRSLGVKAQGSHKLYDYSAELNSSGRYFMDWFPGPEVVGSFGIKPLGMTDGRYGKLLIGGGIDAGNSDSRYTIASSYLDYEYKRLRLTLEYGAADGSNGSSGFSANKSEGYNATLAYRITPKLQLLGRYDCLDPNNEKKNDIRREYTVGFNYFIMEQALKLQLNYGIYSIENGVYGSQIYAGTQIMI